MNNKTYTPKPERNDDIEIPSRVEPLIDLLAQHNHDKWAVDKLKDGFTYGIADGSGEKKNPYLKPYHMLTDDEKEMNIASAESVIRFLRKRRYKIRPDALHWPSAVYRCYKRFYSEAPEPVYKAPLVIGLVGQKCPSDRISELKEAADRFVADIFKRFGLPAEKQENSLRTTPVYILSTLESSSEEIVAGYLTQQYGVEVVRVAEGRAGSDADAAYTVRVGKNADGYIIRSSFMLLALWDGVDRDCRTGAAVRSALLETDPITAGRKFDIEDTRINETRPVYQIVLPSAEKTKFAFRYRMLLPYTLDSGADWYMLRRAVRRGRYCLISDTESYIADGSIKRECEKAVADKKEACRRELRAARIGRKDKEDIKDIRKRLKKTIEDSRYRAKHYVEVENFKKKRFESNISKIKHINRVLEKGRKQGDEQEAYDLMEGSDLHGRMLSVDAVNLRHLNLDTVASGQQKLHRVRVIAMAVCAAVGLSAYSVSSDLTSYHSLLGVVGGVVSAACILAALVIYFFNLRSQSHDGHVNVRMLSEGLRVKTYLNAAGMTDKCVGDYLSERQRIDLEWAQNIFRGWDMLDRAYGFYSYPLDVGYELATVKKLWLGSSDTAADDLTKYSPVKDGQLNFARKRGREAVSEEAKQRRRKSVASAIVVALTLLVAVLAAYSLITNPGLVMPESWNDIIADRYAGSGWMSITETLIVFAIGIVPSITACLLIYKESQMYAENAKRYKWMAVKYQKLISSFGSEPGEGGDISRLSDDEKRIIFDAAGKAAIEELAEWTALVTDNAVNLPF